ncbi:YhcN/YlaJ family sporulation lipoprotein [Cytobacillus sp. FSL W7-1323]|uniref:YhcN/YlaJ family sporulation lipoprotein n=1 Tax=Cytobacillus TaxID=2675230 RepID=UPI001CD5DD88|nr:YhcN/YlaJ family sporulation lipoprotein [Cytobacillus kochii]MCA1027868.1 YhcN/YlaJ family sporulation lipoprotein [Cytobacillus kochii]MCM3324923.1 YhcN/YlaJ family sporulation lipoprotein [Cytobacillus kochii]MCM3347285.1 YhcN/YlaJ family sporulation lipoprotein [Cytobacillus kochii]MDM5209084.1 YhcN/YlaJ family sporulation lipoprotein [Cytobacillus kochii]
MKKMIMFIGISSMVALTGCQAADHSAKGDIYPESGNTVNVNDQRTDIYNTSQQSSEDFGYVRHQKSPIYGEKVSNEHYAAINREKVADIIGKYCTELPNVDDVSTLVTDNEVLIVYNTDSDNRESTATQVEKMAESVVPGWFDIYTTDNTNLRKEIESYSTMDADSEHTHYGIDQLTSQMKKADINKSEKMSNK